MLLEKSCALSLRSYGRDNDPHQHTYSQLVLPLAGTLGIEFSGREALLDRSVAAYIENGVRHTQEARQANRFLVMDIDPGSLDPHRAQRLTSNPLLPLTREANHLIDYMGAALANGTVPEFRIRLWAPLLLDALTLQESQPQSRLADLLATIEASPFSAWTSARMAQKAGLSVSRLHALFRQELDTTPHNWLATVRLQHVRHWLTTTNLPIAELAYRAGFADQSALTRALRKATGLTPAAYRRCHQESGPLSRES